MVLARGPGTAGIYLPVIRRMDSIATTWLQNDSGDDKNVRGARSFFIILSIGNLLPRKGQGSEDENFLARAGCMPSFLGVRFR